MKKFLNKLQRSLSNVYLSMVFLFLYAPIAVLIAFSFNELKSRAKWGGFSLKWYESLFKNDELMSALGTTLLVAILSAVIATIIGTLAAIGIHALRGFLQKVLINVSYLPMLNPDIVTGISLLLLFAACGLTMGFGTLLMAHIAFNIPYVIFSVLPRLRQMNPHMYEAALDLGTTPSMALWKVILPDIRPGIVSGFLLALTLSIDDFVISFFVTGPGVSTLSIEIYTMARRGVNPEINALSAIMFVTVFLLLLFSNIKSLKKDKKEKAAAKH